MCKGIFGFFLFIAFSFSAEAHDFKMHAGQDAYVFDYDNFYGKIINVYETREGEPADERTESIAHDWFALEDIVAGIPNALSGMPSPHPLAIGRTGEIGANAFAAIYGGKRYIVMSHQIHSNYGMMALVMGHELGHHVCGHTSGTMTQNPWTKELEADTFSGMTIRAGSFGLNLNDALLYAAQLFSPGGSTTHPPLAMRINAIVDGYNNGSPCIGRQVPLIASNELGGNVGLKSVEPLWSHNGSVVRLIANGADRRFVYESPKNGLAAVGVGKGTLLFKGRRSGNSYSGDAYIFSHCRPIAYKVSGAVSSDDRQVTMFGRAPIVNESCAVTSYRDDTLVFSFAGD
ncbi:MAG: hypothetical protein E7813_11585 [Bradyrhizobium sp.]|uniref:M48 family metalloprotease n=1 Tax=Bradyrhizobium sp. TaxID=376 RepID=UPI001215F94D|nr:M48 family metalloprotease [Bradyrhizobium sp.]THD68136.1 MAG: hypothetical protein E7813_11585 [Bradyrhizobium sp.]